MCFVDTGALGLLRSLVLPDVLLGRVPEARIVDGRYAELLCDAGDPSRQAFLAGVIVGDDERHLN